MAGKICCCAWRRSSRRRDPGRTACRRCMPRAHGDFRLYEALLCEPASGYFLLEEHLARLAASARHFGFALDPARLRAELTELAQHLPDEPRKVRIELAPAGELFLEH